MLFIYSSHDSPRIDYVLDFIFGQCLETPYTTVDHPTDVPAGQPLLNYSDYPLSQTSTWIYSHAITQIFSVEKQEIHVLEYDGHPAIFGHEEKDAALPYDPLALCFFMLSRFEEYLPYKPDKHGRFPASESAAFKNGFLEHPVVDYAIEDLRNLLNKAWPELGIPAPEFSCELSYDIDAPFAFRGKGHLKNMLGGCLDAIKGRGFDRLKYRKGRSKDVFDIFDELLSQLEDSGINALFFLLLENKGSKNPMIDYNDERYREIVHQLGEKHSLGIHPSYKCQNHEHLQLEISRFKEITGAAPDRSRFHFIRMKIPESYITLIQADIFKDYSMGFPDHPGFRAGTCRKFNFYDLTRELKTNLVVHPFCLMDATFEYYDTKASEQEIVQRIEVMTERLKKAKGELSWVFHNDLMSGYSSKYDWKRLHEGILTS